MAGSQAVFEKEGANPRLQTWQSSTPAIAKPIVSRCNVEDGKKVPLFSSRTQKAVDA